MSTIIFEDSQHERAPFASDPRVWSELTTSFQNAAYAKNHPEDEGGLIEQRNHVLYAYFSRDGHPLYVGMTDNPGQRMADHRRSSPWYRRATAYYWSDWNCCRQCLRDMEAMAIQLLDPSFNIQGKS